MADRQKKLEELHNKAASGRTEDLFNFCHDFFCDLLERLQIDADVVVKRRTSFDQSQSSRVIYVQKKDGSSVVLVGEVSCAKTIDDLKDSVVRQAVEKARGNDRYFTAAFASSKQNGVSIHFWHVTGHPWDWSLVDGPLNYTTDLPIIEGTVAEIFREAGLPSIISRELPDSKYFLLH